MNALSPDTPVQLFVMQKPLREYSLTHEDGRHEMVAFLPVVEVVGR